MALGLGLITPNIILVALELHLYVGHIRLKSRTDELIKHNLQ